MIPLAFSPSSTSFPPFLILFSVTILFLVSTTHSFPVSSLSYPEDPSDVVAHRPSLTQSLDDQDLQSSSPISHPSSSHSHSNLENNLIDTFSSNDIHDHQLDFNSDVRNQSNHNHNVENDLSIYSASATTPSEDGQGWLAHWLSLGGEGTVTVLLGSSNLTFPHRPAAFPSHLDPRFALPISGKLVHFASLHPPSASFIPFLTSSSSSPSDSSDSTPFTSYLRPAYPPSFACDPLPIRSTPPHPSVLSTVALIERGGCDFATKVRNAMYRGARAVIVGDGVMRDGESDEEGLKRETLITMFSPEDTLGINIPSVFVSRASFIVLRNLLDNHTHSGTGTGLWVDISEGSDEGNALSSLLSFALLMPTFILLITIGIHRLRVARQREADRAPPLVVLSLPERIWTPDIVWEKEDDSDDSSTNGKLIPTRPTSSRSQSQSKFKSKSKSKSPSAAPREALDRTNGTNESGSSTISAIHSNIPNPTPISSSEVQTLPHTTTELEDDDLIVANSIPTAAVTSDPSAAGPVASSSGRKKRTRSSGKRYFSKDECAICMDNFKKGEIVRILPCGHVFHKNECDEWLLKWRKLCPTCRADVTVPSTDMSNSVVLTPVGPEVGAGTTTNTNGGGGVQGMNIGDWRERFTRTIYSFRESVFGTGGDGSVDERTPLIRPRSTSPIQARGRQLEGSV